MIQQQNRLLDALAAQLNAGAGIVRSKDVSTRLRGMAEFYRVMRDAMEDAMRRRSGGASPRCSVRRSRVYTRHGTTIAIRAGDDVSCPRHVR
jgi:hypothetical protein